jgi:Zn-dependent protease with chaperone function
MIYTTDAIYYDGKSSTPQQINLNFDKNSGVFYFESQNKKGNKWRFNEVVFANRDGTLTVKHKHNSFESLRSKNVEFINAIQDFRRKNKATGWYENLLNYGFKAHMLIALFILGFIALSYLILIPWVAEKSVILIPEDYDNKIGSLVYSQIIDEGNIDSTKTKSLNLFAKELKLNNKKQLHFTVVNSDIVNAFALPDGNIVVYSGILKTMKNYEELVALIGHESAHVNNRHSMKMMCRNLSGYLFVSAVLGDVNGIMATVGDNVNTLQSLSFSREFEKDADRDGFAILKKNNVNPKGMSTLFSSLQKEEKGMVTLPEFMNSHPVTQERIKYINKLITNNKYAVIKNNELQLLFTKIRP